MHADPGAEHRAVSEVLRRVRWRRPRRIVYATSRDRSTGTERPRSRLVQPVLGGARARSAVGLGRLDRPTPLERRRALEHSCLRVAWSTTGIDEQDVARSRVSPTACGAAGGSTRFWFRSIYGRRAPMRYDPASSWPDGADSDGFAATSARDAGECSSAAPRLRARAASRTSWWTPLPRPTHGVAQASDVTRPPAPSAYGARVALRHGSDRFAARALRLPRLPSRPARGLRGGAGGPRRARGHAHRVGQVALLPAARPRCATT